MPVLGIAENFDDLAGVPPASLLEADAVARLLRLRGYHCLLLLVGRSVA
jgi:hypothetical protein